MRATALLVLAGCAAAPHPPPTPATDPIASHRAQVEADIALINSYRLTDATLSRYIAAARGFTGVQRIFSDTLFRRGAPGPTIDDLAGILERNHATRSALANAGITSREFVTFIFTLFQAGMAAWLVEQHGWDKLPPEIARDNVVFYQLHKTQLDSLTAELKQREGDLP